MQSLVATLTLCAVLALPAAASAQFPYKAHTVTSADGVKLAVQEWGNPGAPPVLFIHGFTQTHLSWDRQIRSDLAKDFRLITFDLRGHGASDKPLVAEAYKESTRWADDINAIITQVGLRKPVLVGWSYGGRVINDYLTHYGDGAIAGINYVAATSTTKSGVLGPGLQPLAGMASEDLATNIESTKKFLANCYKIPPSAEDMATALAFNMLTPAKVRGLMGGRPAPYDPVLAKLTVPVLVTQGRDDLLVLPAMSEHTLSIVKHAKSAFYDGVGHVPFQEVADRYNADLGAFLRAIPR